VKRRDGGSNPTVAVVGAGLSGLRAAWELHRRGVDVAVLESADRIGGRSMAETSVLGSRLDLGGQWIGHDHHRVKALASELGLVEFDMHTQSLPTVVDGERRVSPASPSVLMAGLVLAGVAAISRTGTPERLNDSAIDVWLRRVPGRRTRRLLELTALTSWTADLDRISVHAIGRMIHTQGGLKEILSTTGGAQESLIAEGVGSLAERLAAELGSRVRTGHRVDSIAHGVGGVTVASAAGELAVEKVIVSPPAPIAARIRFDPPLPPERVALGRHTYMGTVYKAIAVYERPFWRERGGGELVVLGGPGSAVFDSTPPDGPGHLCFLVGGPGARELDELDAAGRRRALLGPLAHHIGAEVLEPAGWHEKSWHLDEHAGGGYVAMPMPGTTDGFWPHPCEPVGNVHWAGAETASDHPGYLDGALEAGERAAREVFQGLLPKT